MPYDSPHQEAGILPNLRTGLVLLLVSLSHAPWSALSTALHAQPVSLQSLPEVTLEAAESAVREQLEAQRSALNALLEGGPAAADAGKRAALANAFGQLGQLYVLYDLSLPAEAALSNAIQLAPNTPRWRYLLATQHQLDNRVEAAAAGFRAVLELQPENGAAHVRLGNLLLRAERPQAARPHFERALDLEGTRAAALEGLGRAAKAQGDFEQAARHLAAALQEQPEANLLHFHLGEVYRDLGDSERARFHFANRGDRKVFFYDPVALELQQQAGGVGALLSLGRISLSMGELTTAKERFAAALEIDPDSAAVHRSLASVLQREGDLSTALEHYERAIELEPDDASLRYFVAQFIDELVVVAEDPEVARQQRSHWDQRAVTHLEAALEIAPDFVPAWVLLADVHQRQGEHRAADEALQNAQAIAPGETDLHYLRAKVLAKLGERAAGLEQLLLFDRAQQQADRPLAAEARIERALLLIGLGETARGTTALRGVADSTDETVAAKHRARAWFELGNEQADGGELEGAVISYRKAIELDPQNPLTHFNLGTVLGRLERFAQAAQAHRRASELDPESQQARFAEAMALLLGGQDEEARRRLEDGLEVLPAAAPLGHLLARLLVAAPSAEVRQPEVGLDLAYRLFDAFPTIAHAETVAMGLAATGRFDKAAEWQQRVVDELEGNAPSEAVEDAQRLLAAYRAGQTAPAPWQENDAN